MKLKVFWFALLTLALFKSGKCKDIIGNREVIYQRVPQNFFTAYEICRSIGMQLLTITREEETDQIYELAKKYKPRPSFWLAATDLGHEGEFVWTTTGVKLTNARWYKGQPDNAGGIERCAEITYRWNDTATWNDIPCDRKNPFFCESVWRWP